MVQVLIETRLNESNFVQGGVIVFFFIKSIASGIFAPGIPTFLRSNDNTRQWNEKFDTNETF